MTPDAEILSLGVMALRIEAFAEPYVCCGNCCLWSFYRYGRYTHAEHNELCQYMGCTS